jgi:uncharacterized damage-inducible protein DinB
LTQIVLLIEKGRTPMAYEAIQGISERLRQAQEAFKAQLAGVTESQFHQAPKEGEWSPAEIVAHICESPSFFVAKAIRMTLEDTPFIGRSEEDLQTRLRAIADHSQDRLEVALDMLERANALVLKAVGRLKDEQLHKKGRHPQRGVVTVQQVLESIVSHIEEHTRQLSDTLGS